MATRKIIWTVLCFIATLPATFAQISLLQGPEVIVEKGAKFDRVIGSDDKAFYVYRIKTHGEGTHYYVEKYDKASLKIIFSKDLNLEEIKNVNLDPNQTDTYTVMDSGRIHVIFPIHFKSTSRKVLALKTISTTGVVSSGYKEIAGEEGKPEFIFRQSPDGSKFIVVTVINVEKSIPINKVTLYKASDISVVWKKEMPGSYQKSGISIINYSLANDGTLGFFFIYMKDFEKEEVGAAAAIMHSSGNESSALELDLSVPKEPYTMAMNFTSGNRLACVGLFKDAEKVKKAKKTRNAGVFFYLVDVASMSLIASGDKYFPTDVASQLTYSSPEGGDAPGDKYYASLQLEEAGDDYYFMTEHGYDMVGSSVTKVRKEVIVSKINGTSGEVEWIKLLQKSSLNRSGMYNVMAHGENLYVFCLEHPDVQKRFDAGKNYEPGRFPAVNGISGCNVRAYNVNSSGIIKGSIIYTNKDFCYYPQNQDITLDTGNKLLIYLQKDDKEKFGTIEIK